MPIFRSLVTALAITLVAAPALRAGHVDDGAYPYVTEITVELRAQEKLYSPVAQRALTFSEKITTRSVRYKFWASGLLSVQNEPDDDNPHGPLRDIGLMVHEVGINRIGKSELRLELDNGKPVLVLDQDTQLVRRDGKKTPGVRLKARLPVKFRSGSLADFSKRARITIDLTKAGEKALRNAIVGLLQHLYTSRRTQINEGLKDNGLVLEPNSVKFKVDFIGARKFKASFDNSAKFARVRLPDIRVSIRAEISQNYE